MTMLPGVSLTLQRNSAALFQQTIGFSSGQSRDRTGDLAIFSRSLYQLSYLSLKRQITARRRSRQPGWAAAQITCQHQAVRARPNVSQPSRPSDVVRNGKL